MSDHARRLREATAAVVAFLCDELEGHGADPDPLQEALVSLGIGYRRMENLREYFDEHPDGLTSGRSDGPASRLYLLQALVARYPAQVALPRCGGCDRAVRLPQMGEDGQRRCAACYARLNVAECVLCGAVRAGKTKSARTLHRLAQQGDDITHDVLDAAPAGKHLDYVAERAAAERSSPAEPSGGVSNTKTSTAHPLV